MRFEIANNLQGAAITDIPSNSSTHVMDPEKADQIRYDAMLDSARSDAIDTMRRWFLQRYEDPVKNTPYDSAEGGYIYVWGGPYDAHEVLFDEFGNSFSESEIDEVVGDLEQICSEWARIPTAEDFDLGSVSISEHFSRAIRSLSEIRDTLSSEVRYPVLNAPLYAHVITILEAFLSEAFASGLKDRGAMRAYVESDPAFKEEKVAVSEIYRTLDAMETKVGERLNSTIFHQLGKVQRMFRDTFGIEMPTGFAVLARAIQTRHDIIHRNCSRKDGTNFSVSSQEVVALVDVTEKFIRDLAERIGNLNPVGTRSSTTAKRMEPNTKS